MKRLILLFMLLCTPAFACGDAGGTVTGCAADSGGITTGATVTIGGGNGITTSRSGDTITVAADLTKINSHTWGAGTQASQTETHAVTGSVQPMWTYTDGLIASNVPIQTPGTGIGNSYVQLNSGGALRTDVHAADVAYIQAYDVDGAAYTTFATLTANNTPTFDLSSAVTVNGVPLVGTTTTQTLTNKRITRRVGTTTSSATPTINTDNVDEYGLTAQTADITSFTTNLTGTPSDGDVLIIRVTGTASRGITWGAKFASGDVTLPTTTSGTKTLVVMFKIIGAVSSTVWQCMASTNLGA